MKSARIQRHCNTPNNNTCTNHKSDSSNHSGGFGPPKERHKSESNQDEKGINNEDLSVELSALWRKQSPCIYRLSDSHNHHSHHHHFNGNGQSLFQQVCVERGWREFSGGSESGGGGKGGGSSSSCSSLGSEDGSGWGGVRSCGGGSGGSGGGEEWNLWWRSTTMKSSWVRCLSPWQLINHIPKARTFSRKDALARYLRRMHHTHGPIYDFSPVSFNLPLEYTRLCSEHSRRARLLHYGDPSTCDEPNLPFPIYESNQNPPPYTSAPRVRDFDEGSTEHTTSRKNPIWICKPVGKSQGRGIHVFDRVAELAYDASSVVQEYIVRPYLIGGYKWDLRIYTCILSVSPLVIYAYKEGLTRFATNKYDLNCLCNHFSHLTNTSLNKQSPQYKVNKEEIGQGCKWTLGRLRRYFQDNGVADWALWQRIMSILVLTIVGEAHTLTSLDVGGRCFELLGFDILVDHNMKPTLLEVNTNPGLRNDCLVDEIVKRPMLHDLMSLLGLPDDRADSQTIIPPQISNLSSRHDQDSKMVSSQPQPKSNISAAGDRDRDRGSQTVEDKRKEKFSRANSANSANLSKATKRLLKFQRQASLDGNGNPRKISSSSSGSGRSCRSSCSSSSSSSRTFHNSNLNICNSTTESWQTDVTEVGGWVRIFPFDSQTKQNKVQMSTHDIKLAIARMHNYMRIVGRIGRKEKKDDSVNDMMAKHYGRLSVEPWHPDIFKQRQTKQTLH